MTMWPEISWYGNVFSKLLSLLSLPTRIFAFHSLHFLLSSPPPEPSLPPTWQLGFANTIVSSNLIPPPPPQSYHHHPKSSGNLLCSFTNTKEMDLSLKCLLLSKILNTIWFLDEGEPTSNLFSPMAEIKNAVNPSSEARIIRNKNIWK